MLHGLLLSLKIIGMLVLAVLLLLIIILGMILFVPLNYQVNGSYHREIKGSVKVSWLLHMISVVAAYDKTLSITLRIVGIQVYPVKRKQKKKLKRVTRDIVAEVKDTVSDIPQEAKTIAKDLIEPSELKVESESGTAKPKRSSKQKKREPKESILIRIKKWWIRCCERYQNINIQIEQIRTFCTDDKNQKVMKMLLKETKKVIRHIAPRKGKGIVIFGFDDPYITGQVLSVISLFYGWYPKRLSIVPIFDDELLEVDVKFRGHIRAIMVLNFLLRIYRTKRIRIWLKKWRSRGGI